MLTTLEKEILAHFFGSFLEERKNWDEPWDALTHFNMIAEDPNLSEHEIQRLKYIAFHFARMIQKKEYVGGKFTRMLQSFNLGHKVNLDYMAGFFFGKPHCFHFLEAYNFWKSQGGVMPQF